MSEAGRGWVERTGLRPPLTWARWVRAQRRDSLRRWPPDAELVRASKTPAAAVATEARASSGSSSYCTMLRDTAGYRPSPSASAAPAGRRPACRPAAAPRLRVGRSRQRSGRRPADSCALASWHSAPPPLAAVATPRTAQASRPPRLPHPPRAWQQGRPTPSQEPPC